MNARANDIGRLREQSLHAALKNVYSQPGDRIEAQVAGYVIDIERDGLLIEIQTRHFGAMKAKLTRLLPDHRILLVHPIAQTKWIKRIDMDGVIVGRRRSPKRGRVIDVFTELVRIPGFLTIPNLTVEVVMIEQEEVRINDGAGSWRRKGWSIHDRKLLDVQAQHRYETARDYLTFIPPELDAPFSNRDLALAKRCTISLAQKMTYTLRQMSLLSIEGKKGNAYLYNVIRA